MPYFTHSGNKLLMTVLAAGALAVGGTGMAAMADSLPDSPVAPATESPSPTPTETTTEPEPSPTATETESPEPEPTETETDSPEPEPTETETPEPEPTETDDADDPPASTPVGPDVNGPAAVGLCNAFERGGLNSTSTAYTVLMQAAGGAESIDDYCTTIPAPVDTDDGTDDGGTNDSADGGVTNGATNDDVVQPQNVEPQLHDAPASNGGAGHQGSSARNSHQGQR
ncbi:MAG TPA: hypothetical protein VFS79_14620 [Arthrobacter sp.]|nr:hypothetical protein [Arthrobacter sp.]